MDNIITFTPRKTRKASENVNAFVDVCRNQLQIFGRDLDFDADSWEVGAHLRIKGKENIRMNLRFADFDSSKSTKKWAAMSEPFLSFAKAYLRYMHGFRPTKAVANRLIALRALERALSEHGQAPAIHRATPETFNRATALVIGKYNATAYRVGTELEQIASFCTENSLSTVSIQWKSYIKRPSDKNRVSAEAEVRRKEKLPSKAALEALPKAFHLAVATPDVIVTSAAAILCGNPCRINEVLSLPVNCEVEHEIDGKRLYGLRWWPSKGAEPMIKWIVPSMVDVVKEAVRKIRQHTDNARTIARWYEMNPGRLYMPKELQHLALQRKINCKNLAKVLGLSEVATREWCLNKKIKMKDRHYNLADIEEAIGRQLPKNFPVFDSATGLKYGDALFVAFSNGMNQQRGTFNFMFVPVTIAQINDGLGAGIKHGRSSIFSRMGFTEEDGSPIKITTHRFRHWLNTMAQRGGMSQLDIAKWSGRVNIHHNKDYDHMTADELLQKLRIIAGDDINVAQLPTGIKERNPVAREEFIKMMIPAAHTTELGFCVHDWTFLPCQLHRDCINCSEHCYIKGDETRMVRIRLQLFEAVKMLANAKKAVAEEYAGADRWTEHQQATVDRLRNLVQIFDDPDCPNGSLIRLSSAEMPSRIRFAMKERAKLMVSPNEMTAIAEG